jgi:hypothetical protein
MNTDKNPMMLERFDGMEGARTDEHLVMTCEQCHTIWDVGTGTTKRLNARTGKYEYSCPICRDGILVAPIRIKV